MSAHVKILKGDLHLAVSTAFNRGRYVLMTGGGDGQPIEITIDLRERPDDLFGAESEQNLFDNARRYERDQREALARYTPESFLADDHGPAIPAQPESFDDGLDRRLRETFRPGPFAADPGPRVYEFALQDAVYLPTSAGLANVHINHAPDLEAANAADWVHVYDRVTRERRTLKRPEPDATLQGLRDVAAELRRGPGVAAARGHGKSEAVRDMVEDRILTESGAYVHVNRPADAPMKGAPVEPPFGCAALPPVGPLTSTEGLRAGDVLRALHDRDANHGIREGNLVRYSERNGEWLGIDEFNSGRPAFKPESFAFVGRPDADGWMTWAGGENPVPGVEVDVDWGSGPMRCTSDEIVWAWDADGAGGDINRFRLAVDTPPAV